jgi:small-conductance mechanosensitive channel
MFGWVEICILSVAALLLIGGMAPRLRPYRSLFWGGSALMLITAVFPRAGNPLGQFLFEPTSGNPLLPRAFFGIAWWVLGAWVVKSLLDLILRRTVFPNDDEPHARRLFADLASGLIYVLAFVGIVDTVFRQPISAFLATSGVMAIVLGLALQNTLADVFAGLAINIERPYMAGDWISVTDNVSGQVIEVNWRATRIRTTSNDMIVIPNSVASKAIVTNHCRPNGPHFCSIRIKVDHQTAPSHVIDTLQEAAKGTPGISSGAIPTACATEFSDALVAYDLALPIDDYALTPSIQSEVVRRIAEVLKDRGIRIGAPAMNVRLIQSSDGAGPNAVAPKPIATVVLKG